MINGFLVKRAGRLREVIGEGSVGSHLDIRVLVLKFIWRAVLASKNVSAKYETKTFACLSSQAAVIFITNLQPHRVVNKSHVYSY